VGRFQALENQQIMQKISQKRDFSKNSASRKIHLRSQAAQ
jgi:hypothetical protein